MRRRRTAGRAGGWAAAWAAVIATAVGGRPAAAADHGADHAPEQAAVEAAITKGRNYLFAHQVAGNWEAIPAPDPEDKGGYSVKGGQWGGLTAIATLALLAAGTDPKDPHVSSAIAFLRGAKLTGVYAVGLRAQVWAQLAQEPWVRQAELADLKALESAVHLTKGAATPTSGLYGYTLTADAKEADHSVSQYGVLGMWALAQAGLEVPTGYWQLVDAAWHRQQIAPDGSWAYYAAVDPKDANPTHAPDLSMTAAGVATLFITQESLQIAPRCDGNPDDPGIDAGLRYLGRHATDLPTFGRYYALFGLSRVGLASGYKYLGTTDWFRAGSDVICREQSPSGGWLRYMGDGNINANGVPDTSFCLLFLARGRAPVMMSKLQYDVVGTGKGSKPVPGTWDQRPRDVANLSRWVGKALESPLNWQVVNLRATAGDLHEAPLLYMAGGRAPKLSGEDAAKLRAYLEDGGLLVGHADCRSPEFAKGFKELGESMFPGRKFRPLEATHPIYTNETFPRGKWKQKLSLDGLSNGARELMVLLPMDDPAREWQSQSFTSAKTDTDGQVMIDLFLYAVDKEGSRRRGETYLVDRDAGVPASKPVRVARVKYAGNWDPEPGGWRRLANDLHDRRVAELSTEPVDPATTPIDAKAFPLASLTVAAPDAQLTEPARAAVRAYVKAGGTLLVDVAGGASPYRSAAEAEIAKLFPDAPHTLPVLPADSPVYTAIGPRLAVKSVDYRRFDRVSRAAHVPQLRAATVDGRPAVLYTPEDVSVGLVGQPIDGVAGYTPADATKVVTAVLAYAAKLKP